MNRMNMLFSRQAFPLVAVLVLVAIATDADAQTDGYWQVQSSEIVKNGTPTCVRTGNWTPELATAKCDPDLMPKAAVVSHVDSVPEAHAVSARVPAVEKVTMDADALFDFDKSIIRPKGKAALDEVVRKLNLAGAELGLIVSTGHTDSTGGSEYNMDLSMRRSEAVKTYLISKGIDADSINTVGEGERQPIADNATAAGRAENRRVEIEVTSTRTTP